MRFYFYDLETSGFNSRSARIMQFAGQRTDMNLKPVGKPDNFYIKITPDILPDPYAVLVTGITPQKTLKDGISEADFTKLFSRQIVQPDTIFVGFNTVRFDDEFMRHLLYRNFYDPYEWQWQHGCSRWDLLDVSRMTRALRPGGLKWPFNTEGRPTNQLGLLASINKLTHANAHDALSDVLATIELARLLKTKQPRLFAYLLKMRSKDNVAKLVGSGQPFIYTSGKYSSDYEKTTVAVQIADHPKRPSALVYDLRHDPTNFSKLTPEKLAEAWINRDPEAGPILPLKTLAHNRCPAVAPLATLKKTDQERLDINLKEVADNFTKLKQLKDWPDHLLKALEILDKRQQERLFASSDDLDNQLYDNFFSNRDKMTMQQIRSADPGDLLSFTDKLEDKRLVSMLPLYKARNFPSSLDDRERKDWEKYRLARLTLGGGESQLNKYESMVGELQKQLGHNKAQKAILEDLKAYAASVRPD